ncbi:amino acid ABC transporter substrate-binding protein, PAAT family (TC 3.A.1.3.-) [Pseudovibrio ascidiaceicola]|uniref:Amino acid ABC transporter substrate-binding protein, PAAT family (TC 3.A.1.3.-) n=2 Tax=Pseudovibrio ascidiaceicola TaxID=285279 RepID=A0A1I4BDI7_9HYPH|nr:amino acid ABC transporter substrate-binding protein, PAAT family (TC 3.A.1.3.-) [Pseudovibrio ascidiaceicola]
MTPAKNLQRGIQMGFMRFATVATLALLASTQVQAKEWTKVRIGTEASYPPFAYTTADGKLIGFEIELGNALCAELKVECEWMPVDWDGLIPGLVAGKYDTIMASMSITPERKQRIQFSEKYYQTPPGVAVPNDSKITEASIEGMSGALVGAQVGATHAVFAEDILTKSEVSLYPTADEYKLDLESGRLDAAVDDVVVLSDWLKSEEGNCCKLLGTMSPIPEIHGEGVGVGVRKNDQDLADLFSKAVIALRENGKYKEINDKYFDFDAYGE